MNNRRTIPSRSFSKQFLIDEPKVPETYSSDRRFVLGVRKPPIHIEKVAKFPDLSHEDKTLTMYAQANIYSMLVYNNTNLVFKCKSKDNDPQNETNIEKVCQTPIEAISPAPAGGFLLNFKNVGLVYFTNFGGQIEVPLSNDNSWNGCLVSLTSFHWIMPSSSQIVALVGTMFGHVYTLSIYYKAQDIPVKELYKDKNQTPVASITSITYGGVLYLLVTTYRNLKIIKWDNTNEDPAEIDTPSGPNVCVPSFVCSNETHVSWLSHDDLRTYTFQQVIDGPQIPAILGIEDLKKLFDISDTTAFFGKNTKPIIMSKYYTIIVGPTAILGFSLEDCTVQFRYPISGQSPLVSLNYDKQMGRIHVATQKRLYDIDLSSEIQAETIKPIKQVKEELISEGKTSKEVRAAEVLSSLLENKEYEKAISMLHKHLQRVVAEERAQNISQKQESQMQNQDNQANLQSGQQRRRRPSERIPPNLQKQPKVISREKVKQLCEEFFIFELSVILASESNNAKAFNPQIVVDDDDFDIFAALSKLLQLRAFSSVSDQIYNEKIFETAKNSPLIVRMLLDDNKVKEAIDMILKFGPTSSTESLSSIVFKYRQILKDLRFYDRIQEPSVKEFVLSILPFVAGDIPTKSAYYLLYNELLNRQPKHIDLLLWSLASSEDGLASKCDKEVKEQLKKKVPLSNIISNPYTSLQYCLRAKMFRTATLIASSCGLHEEAVLAAVQIENKEDAKNEAFHSIKRAPRPMQPHLCRLAGVDLDADDEGTFRAGSKEAVLKVLDRMEEKLDDLQKKFEESEEFLNTLQDLGGDECERDNICAVCKKPLVRITGYTFPCCGHSFHEECLLNATMPCLTSKAEMRLLSEYKKTRNTEDKDAVESKMTEECPICGVVAVNSISTPLEDDVTCWPVDIQSIISLAKK